MDELQSSKRKTAVFLLLPITLMILLTWGLFSQAGSLAAQEDATATPIPPKLPPVLQTLVDENPPTDNNVLYQIPGVFTAVSVSGSGKDDSFVYLPDVQGVSWQWQARDDTFQTNNLLGFAPSWVWQKVLQATLPMPGNKT